MIVLDTSVVSEVMRPHPAPAVLAWLNEQAAESVYLSAITVSEQLFGIRALPAGKRRDALRDTFEELLQLFDDRVLPFDMPAARCHAEMAAHARREGRGFPSPDGYIAAIALSRGFIVASRDASAFEAGGVRVIDPWQQASRV